MTVPTLRGWPEPQGAIGNNLNSRRFLSGSCQQAAEQAAAQDAPNLVHEATLVATAIMLKAYSRRGKGGFRLP